MGCFQLAALCLIFAISDVWADKALQYGANMLTRAYDAVCWYENLKLPVYAHQDNGDQYSYCSQAAHAIKQTVDNPDPFNADYFAHVKDAETNMYAEAMLNDAMQHLSPDYSESCGQYFKDVHSQPPSDESDALNEPSGKEYPLKAATYCLIKALRDKHGQQAIEAVKSELTHSHKNWRQTLLDRENEYRARHGAPPLKMVKDLTNQAQEWAEDNAQKCDMYHSSDNDPRNKFRGEATGESLAAAGGDNDDSREMAYIAPNSWYSEVKDYPFPEGYHGDGSDPLFEKIGHFTQSVWKNSKYVGYGYAYNKNCGPGGMTKYVAARYYPAGNDGGYAENVAPPQ